MGALVVALVVALVALIALVVALVLVKETALVNAETSEAVVVIVMEGIAISHVQDLIND